MFLRNIDSNDGPPGYEPGALTYCAIPQLLLHPLLRKRKKSTGSLLAEHRSSHEHNPQSRRTYTFDLGSRCMDPRETGLPVCRNRHPEYII